MQETITSIVIDRAGVNLTNLRLAFSAFTFNPVRRERLDGRITKVTGLESPSVEVSGGPVSYGGSVYTGARVSDREVVITVKPQNMSVSEIKNKLNTLVSLSLSAPLLLKIHTRFENGEDSLLQEECYITSVSSPIFESDNSVQITLKLGRPYLEREIVEVGRGEIQGVIQRDFTVLDDRYIQISLPPPADMDDHYVNAPSPVRLSMRLTHEAGRHLRSVIFRDGLGNRIVVSLKDLYVHSGAASTATLDLTFDTESRSVFGRLSIATNPDIKDANGYVLEVIPTWPMLSPISTVPWVDFTFDSDYTRFLLSDLTFTSYAIWPRVFGI